jgi:8-oxo-dGTP pyrophosphatase MutT (NUDIX family)
VADISFDLDDTRFHYRVAGVALRGGRVLLSSEGREQYWILPGGRVGTGERSDEALARELREELGGPAEVGALLWSVEHFFDLDGVSFHELLLCYRVELPHLDDRSDVTGVDDPRVRYVWHPVDALDGVPLRPTFLRRALARPPSSAVHVVDPAR